MRNMKRARRVGNGELVLGYYVYQNPRHYIVTEIIDTAHALKGFRSENVRLYIVDPATVEDVAVKPIDQSKIYTGEKCGACPNCNNELLEHQLFCLQCGQRIDWSGEDGE